MLTFLVIAVVVGFCAALLAWWLLRPHGRTGSDRDWASPPRPFGGPTDSWNPLWTRGS